MAAGIIFATVVLAIVIYYFRNSNKVSKEAENIPHVSGIPVALAYLRNKNYDEIEKVVVESSKGHDIYVSTIGSFSQVTISNPDYVRTVLMESEDNIPKFEHPSENITFKFFGDGIAFSNGDKWRAHRSLAAPALNGDLPPEIVGEIVIDFFALMKQSLKLDQPVDVYEYMQRIAIEALGKLAFGHRFGCFESEETPHLISLYRSIMATVGSPYRQLFPWINKLPTESNRKFFGAIEEFDGFIFDIIKAKRKAIAHEENSNNKRVDVLETMLKVGKQEGICVDTKELRDEMVNYFIAGHDTTSTALCTTLFYLAKNPEMLDKARAEAINVLGNEPIIPSSEQLKELKYISAVIKESLRIHPPTPTITFRKINKPIKVGPYTLPKGIPCSVNAWKIHHDPKYWEEPDKFDPERFLSNENNEKRHLFSWVPFSAGPRNCIGQNFTIMEQKVVLSMMLLKYNWTIPEDDINKEKLLFTSRFILQPVDIRLIFTERN